MKIWPTSITSHLLGEAADLCVLWEFTRRDGAVYRYAALDADITVDGDAYIAGRGFDPAEVSRKLGTEVGGTEMFGFVSPVGVTQQDVAAGLWDGAEYRIYIAIHSNPLAGRGLIESGTLGNLSLDLVTESFRVEARDLRQALQQEVGTLITSECRFDLGGHGCWVDLEPYTVTGTVLEAMSRLALLTDVTGDEDNYYQWGVIQWMTGRNAGATSIALSSSGASGAMTLMLAPGYHPDAGDTFSVHAGCDKKSGTCRERFENFANFGGLGLLSPNESDLGDYQK